MDFKWSGCVGSWLCFGWLFIAFLLSIDLSSSYLSNKPIELINEVVEWWCWGTEWTEAADCVPLGFLIRSSIDLCIRPIDPLFGPLLPGKVTIAFGSIVGCWAGLLMELEELKEIKSIDSLSNNESCFFTFALFAWTLELELTVVLTGTEKLFKGLLLLFERIESTLDARWTIGCEWSTIWIVWDAFVVGCEILFVFISNSCSIWITDLGCFCSCCSFDCSFGCCCCCWFLTVLMTSLCCYK